MKVEIENSIHKCNTITDWVNSGLSLAKDTTIKYEGSASIRIAGITGGDWMYYPFSPILDLSNVSYLYFYWRRDDYGYYPTLPFHLRLWEDAGNYSDWHFSISTLETWLKLSCDLSNPDSSVGDLDFANINRLYFTFSQEFNLEAWVDYIYGIFDVTSDILAESYIETEQRESPKAMIIAKGTWFPEEGNMITIKDYYTSAGSTIADQVIFEGIIQDYPQKRIRIIPCISRAKRDLDEYRPKESLSGDVDSEYLKTLIGKCAYITQGTIDATTPNTSYKLKGDKTFRSFSNDLADKHKKMWALTPTGASNFEDADVDSGEDYDQSDKIWGVRPKKQVRKINKVHIYGAIVNNVQLEATAVDQDSIDQIGEILYKDTYAMITDQTELNTMATNLLAREGPATSILSVNFWNRHVNKGLLQVGETITFAHSKTYPAITSQQMILRKIKYFFKSQKSYFEVDSGLVFKKKRDRLLPQENSLLIQQNAEAISEASVQRVTSANYTGDGTADRTIGIAFGLIQMIFVIRTDDGQESYIKTPEMSNKNSKKWTASLYDNNTIEIFYSGTSFKISGRCNENGNPYRYIVFSLSAPP